MRKLSILLFLLFLFPLATCKRTPPDFRGKIVFINGKVTVDKKTASIDQIVPEGATIVTGPGSVCDVIFNEKNIIRIDPESSLELTLNDKESKIKLNKGTIMSVLYKLLKADVGMQVQTPTAVASIRGTSFYIKVEDPKNTYLCDCNGIIKVSDIDGTNTKILKASHHKGMRITKGAEGITMSDARMLYHVDGNINKIAKKIDVEVDWTEIHGD